jgi:hypothetical protein
LAIIARRRISKPQLRGRPFSTAFPGEAGTGLAALRGTFLRKGFLIRQEWIIEKFMAYELPDDLKKDYHADLTPDVKRKILGENAARLYGIDIETQAAKLSRDGIISAALASA